MTWETIGSVTSGQLPDDEAWILFAYKLAREYVVFVCGEPPPGSELGIRWQDHDLGAYPTLALWSEFTSIDEYVAQCERTFEAFNDAVDWEQLLRHFRSAQPIDSEDAEGG